jgi:hypothetical protein
MKSTLVWLLAVPLVIGASILSQPTLSAAQAAADAKSHLSPGSAGARSSNKAANVYPIEQGYVDAHGEMIYYEIIGHGPPLMIVHGSGSFARLLPSLPAAACPAEQAGVYRRARLRTFAKA